MQQKYDRLQQELRDLAKSAKQDEDNVLKLLNKRILEGPKQPSTHPQHLRMSRFSLIESTIDEEQLLLHKNEKLSALLNDLFVEKCKLLDVFSSEDRRKTLVATLLKKNKQANFLDLSVCNLPEGLSKQINKYLTREITRIDLSQNCISIQSLPRLFHSELSELVLSNCNMHNETFDVLFNGLRSTPIVRLCLSSPLPINRNILTKYESFYEFIRETPTLSILELASLQIHQYEELFKVCSKSNVISLDLSGNDKVRGIYPGLLVLKLKNNSLDRLNEFSQTDGFPQLYHLDLSNNQLSGPQFSFLFKSRPPINLKVLIADENFLMYKLENFQHYIAGSSWLEQLSLRKCRIGEEGMRQLLLGVGSNNSSLQRLDLSNNRVSRQNCGCLAEALKASGLKELVLVECQIVDEGGQRLALQLKHNTKLQSLNLTQNRLNYKTGKAFVTTLHFNRVLTKIVLARNTIPYDLMKEIRSSVERNHYLKVKNFPKNPPHVRVTLPAEIAEEEYRVQRTAGKLKSEVLTLQGMYDDLLAKCEEVGDFQQPEDFENDGTAEIKYKKKLESLRSEIAKVQNQTSFLFGVPARTSPMPSNREELSHRSVSPRHTKPSTD